MNHEFGKDPTLARDEEERVLVDSALQEALARVQKKEVRVSTKARKRAQKEVKPLVQGHGRHI